MFKTSRVPVEQLTTLYGRGMAGYLIEKVLAFRALHSHGRALNRLVPRAVEDVEDYDVRDGESIAGVVAGWNFGEGHHPLTPIEHYARWRRPDGHPI